MTNFFKKVYGGAKNVVKKQFDDIEGRMKKVDDAKRESNKQMINKAFGSVENYQKLQNTEKKVRIDGNKKPVPVKPLPLLDASKLKKVPEIKSKPSFMRGPMKRPTPPRPARRAPMTPRKRYV